SRSRRLVKRSEVSLLSRIHVGSSLDQPSSDLELVGRRSRVQGRYVHLVSRNGVHIRSRLQKEFDRVLMTEEDRQPQRKESVRRKRVDQGAVFRDERSNSLGISYRACFEDVQLDTGAKQHLEHIFLLIVDRLQHRRRSIGIRRMREPGIFLEKLAD